MSGGLEIDAFGHTADGTPVQRYTLRSGCRMMLRALTYGATVTELWTPDRRGDPADVVLGFDDLAAYETESPYFGCMVGRVAFRIVGGQVDLDGRSYPLPCNGGPNHMHGGPRGFSKRVWQAEPVVSGGTPAVKFTLSSPDGDQGYPGSLEVAVIYSLTDDCALAIDCTATTDRPTLVNLTHHSYFNLAGSGSGDVLDHRLWIDADRWIRSPRSDRSTDEIAAVSGTPYDFRTPKAIGTDLSGVDAAVGGYDLCYVHNHPQGEPARVAAVWEPSTGRTLEVHTTEPAIVLYTGDYLDGSLRGKKGAVYPKHAGLCLETGRPPDAIHHPWMPSPILRPGQTYRHRCVYRFGAER